MTSRPASKCRGCPRPSSPPSPTSSSMSCSRFQDRRTWVGIRDRAILLVLLDSLIRSRSWSDWTPRTSISTKERCGSWAREERNATYRSGQPRPGPCADTEARWMIYGRAIRSSSPSMDVHVRDEVDPERVLDVVVDLADGARGLVLGNHLHCRHGFHTHRPHSRVPG